MEDLKLVYDFSTRPIDLQSMLLPLLFVAVGFILFYSGKKYSNRFERNRTRGLGIAFILLSGLASYLTIPANLKEYFTTKKMYVSRQYKIVEGRVENFHPMPWAGHDTERFDVKDVHFEFSDYDLTDYGYNNAASKGGAIKADLYVKIAYFNNGNRNVILRLETEK